MEVLWKAIRSLRLTIALFLLLAGASVVGTLIPQNLASEEYSRIYGGVAGSLFGILHITDLYHSPWFMGLIGLLVLNLVACSLHRFPSTWKAIQTPQRPLTDRLWSSLPVRRALAGKGSAEEGFLAISREMARRRWSLREERNEGTIHLLGQRGRYGRMGVYVTHLGVVVILLGAVVGFAFGFKGFVQLHEGQTVDRVQDRQGHTSRELGFQLRCDQFRMTVYPDGTPKEYRSDLSFLQDGSVVLQGPLRVNSPIQYGGYVFYQASYGSSARITLEVGSDSGSASRQMTLDLGENGALDSQGRVLIRPVRYEADLQGRGPAVLLAYLKSTGHAASGWVFKRDGAARVEGWNLKLVDVAEGRWTGLQVKRDPGVWIVWVGCVLVMLGCAVAFLVSHQRVWIRIRPHRGGIQCHVAASAARGRPTLEQQVEDMCRELARKAGLRATDGRTGDE
jgi:cytochrome c biogenesis protein